MSIKEMVSNDNRDWMFRGGGAGGPGSSPIQGWGPRKDEKWDHRFLRMADEYATWSKDPSTKIGCVVVDPAKRRILSGGYNGFPRGIEDTPERLENRELKYKYVVHAEMNAIYNATMNGVSLEGATLYNVGLPTCSACALGVIQVGIKRVIMGTAVNIPDHWKEQWELTKSMFNEAGVFYKFYHDWKSD